MRIRLRVAGVLAVLALAGAGDGAGPVAPAAGTPPLPPPGAPFDYQLGAAYRPPAGTRVVARDREAEPVAGLYNICYVNAFQAQPHELRWWKAHHPELLLRDGRGYVVDEAWNEVLFDISTAARRRALADVVGAWITGCADDGFQAVEPDNLDSYTRSHDLLTRADARAFAALLARRAHRAGLAIAQKNDTTIAPRGPAVGFDFAIAEECNRWSECGAYAAAYGRRVFVVEYRDVDFDAGCAAWPRLSIVRRDLNLTGPRSPAYRYAAC